MWKMTQLLLRPSSPRVRFSTSTRLLSSSSSSSIRPWKQAAVESRGNYPDEAWIEDEIGGPLYQHQKSLPRLPVLSIEDTLRRFLPTALPLAKSPQEAAALKSAVEKFPQQAAHLQERLIQRYQNNPNSSWLQHWWNTAGYLQVRDSVVINVSYFFHFANDPTAANQIQRGAALLVAAADFRKRVVTGQLPAEVVGKHKTPLCSVAYKYMFHACRIPVREHDSYKIYDPARNRHAIVACREHFFRIDFVDEEGNPYPLAVLEEGLQKCRDLADELPPALPLGWLTSQNRDDWADARKTLLEASPQMEQALEVLQSGALMICLDEVDRASSEAMAQLLLHAGRDASAGANRWFDKSIQLVLTKEGQAGLVGEHSMMDGMPVMNFANRLTEVTYAQASALTSANASSCNVEPIFANLDISATQKAQIDGHIHKAMLELENAANRHELEVVRFHGYGSDFIKKAGYSPDAFVQVAMQLATYRLWGEQVGTYEATQVRPFLHGRTETTRTVSTESAAFCQEMGLKPKLDEHFEDIRKEKLRLLKDAVTAHVKYIGAAAKAEGVDRHFFGLSMLLNDGEKAPDLYADPVFARSKRWRVSTSHLTHPRFENWGYGEVFPDGVGLSYSIHKRHCGFSITALKEHDWTEKLGDKLEEALLEMRTLVELDQKPTSKL